jgi:hypothetical protein
MTFPSLDAYREHLTQSPYFEIGPTAIGHATPPLPARQRTSPVRLRLPNIPYHAVISKWGIAIMCREG